MKHFVPQYVAGVKDNLQRLIMGKFARVVAGDVLQGNIIISYPLYPQFLWKSINFRLLAHRILLW